MKHFKLIITLKNGRRIKLKVREANFKYNDGGISSYTLTGIAGHRMFYAAPSEIAVVQGLS